MAVSPLSILAGPDALAEIRDGGLSPEQVRVLVGASGGPKWIVLAGLDRVVFPWLLGSRGEPIHAIGSSIGTWRLAGLCSRDPLGALERLRIAYVEEQRYARGATAADVSAEAERILDAYLREEDVRSIVEHRRVRLHVVTARFRHLGALEGRAQLPALGLAALLNAVSRRALGVSVERVVFDAGGDPGPFGSFRELPTRRAPLTVENTRAALRASAAIPGVMQGLSDPTGAPRGVYRDGGVADYHFGVEIDPPEGIALYPHFYEHLVPGYFDKLLRHRRTRGLRRTVLVAPSSGFVASLPGSKIPDRTDFSRLPDRERIPAWRTVIERTRELGDAFHDLVESGKIRSVVAPLP
ncbi:MAG TPA: hypothetical protein VHE30_01270 [Polyangiaceae bacterium]|nr:hypothetical protein [Polyangiaceae bacterium]